MKTPQLRLIETTAPDLAESFAPPIPVESHLVAAAMAAERLRLMASALANVMHNSPRDVKAVRQIHGEILDAWLAVGDGLDASDAVLSCEGQA